MKRLLNRTPCRSFPAAPNCCSQSAEEIFDRQPGIGAINCSDARFLIYRRSVCRGEHLADLLHFPSDKLFGAFYQWPENEIIPHVVDIQDCLR